MRISDWSSDVCSSDLLIRFKCVRDFVKPICLAFVNPDSGFAELTERPLAMRHHDQTGFSSKISKGLLRLLLELGIPDGRDFVGNIHVEIECKRKGKLEIGSTSCRERGGQTGKI